MLHKVLTFFGAEIVQLHQVSINRAAAGGRGTAREKPTSYEVGKVIFHPAHPQGVMDINFNLYGFASDLGDG